MGLSNNGSEGSTIYLQIAGGAIWDKSNTDTSDPNYKEEEYEKLDGSVGTRKGGRYSSLSGKLQSVFFKENDFGEFMNVYVEDVEDEQLYCLSLPISDGYTAYSNAKRMIIALMMVDKSKPLSIHVMGKKQDSGFLQVTLWVTQDGKSYVLNPDQDPKYFKEDKHIAMPDNIKEYLASTRTKTPEENKVMTKKQKARAREDELEDLVAIFNEFFLEEINADVKEKQAKDAKNKTKKPKAEKPVEAEEEEPPQETALEKLKRLKAERDAKK